MTSSEDGCLSNIYEDADSADGCPSNVFADQESIRSSAIECNSESVHIDSISDHVSQPNPEGLCASSPSSGTAAQVKTPPKIEITRRLRMMDEDADGGGARVVRAMELLLPRAKGGARSLALLDVRWAIQLAEFLWFRTRSCKEIILRTGMYLSTVPGCINGQGGARVVRAMELLLPRAKGGARSLALLDVRWAIQLAEFLWFRTRS
eukprot:s6302_g2.t1